MILFGFNILFVGLMNNVEFKKLDFSLLKFIIVGGMVMQCSVVEKWEQMMGCIVVEGFGMIEMLSVVLLNLFYVIQVGIIGIFVLGIDVKIVDEEENELLLGESGEFCVCGFQVMKGYWQCEEVIKEIMIEDGEWLKMGDIVFLQEDGYLCIVDCKKDMILVFGFNVYFNEVEDEVSKYLVVVECVVVGVLDDKSGEVVKLFVVKSDFNFILEDVIVYCCKYLMGYKILCYVEFCIDLLKINVGKILCWELCG